MADIRLGVGLERIPFAPTEPEERELADAWNSTGSVQAWNVDTLVSLLIVLIDTVPASPTRSGPLPPLDTLSPRAPRPTAAHPRAYRGTTHKPPKPKSAPVLDLRPYLCDNAATGQIVERLRPFWSEAVQVLIDRGHVMPAGEDGDEGPWSPGGVVFTAEIHPFKVFLEPRMADADQIDLARLLRLYSRMRLVDRPDVILGIAAILDSGAPPKVIVQWCEVIEHLLDEHRAGFIELLLRTGAAAVNPSNTSVDITALMQSLCADQDSAYRIYCVLFCISAGGDVDYLLQGFRLSDRLYPERDNDFAHSFHIAPLRGSYPEAEIDRMLDCLPKTAFVSPWMINRIWSACGKLEGAGSFIVERNLGQWPANLVRPLLEAFLLPYYVLDDQGVGKWRALRPHGSLIDRSLTATPEEFREKFVDGLERFLKLIDSSDLTPVSLPNACALLARLCRPPFHPGRDSCYVWVDFLAFLQEDLVAAFIDAPDSSFVQLEKACRLENDAKSIGYGTWAITQILPSLALSTFVQTPARLFRTSKMVGCLDPAERLELVREFAKLPMMNVDTSLLDDDHAYAFIDEYCRGLRTPCIPHAVRAHYDGSRPLSAPRYSHYHAEMRSRWMRACLEHLEDMVLGRLSKPYALGDLDGAAVHALMIERNVDENRRALRKFLKAYWSGRTDYVLEHPLTRRWLEGHPGLDIPTWMDGVSFTGTTGKYGEVTIGVESNPLEALKLGTYVGSCLGLGGMLQYSAAANVLDVNKQVIYARDAKGIVVGRQIVAYSEADELVCFSPYPASAPRDLCALFAEYDQRLADALGVRIHKSSTEDRFADAEYEIACILSSRWWDDDHWQSNPEGGD